jgi:hypothetical protein
VQAGVSRGSAKSEKVQGECKIRKGSRGSANPKTLGECKQQEKGSRGSANPEKAQGGVQILKRLKVECTF